MTSPVTCHQVVYRLLPEKPSTWRSPDRTLEERRQPGNAALWKRVDCYGRTGTTITRYRQCRSLTVCRRDIPAMAGTAVAVRRGTLKRLDQAVKGFFGRVKTGLTGFPRFRGRRRWNSISIVSGARLRGSALHCPGYGRMTVRRRGGTPYPDGVPKSAVLRREGGGGVAGPENRENDWRLAA